MADDVQYKCTKRISKMMITQNLKNYVVHHNGNNTMIVIRKKDIATCTSKTNGTVEEGHQTSVITSNNQTTIKVAKDHLWS